jgi:hypothetical protein
LKRLVFISIIFRAVELSQVPSEPEPNPNQLSAIPPLVTAFAAKSARSLVNNSFVSIPSMNPPLSESGGSRRIRSQTNWSFSISPLSRDLGVGGEW